jgi:hypothetical protein
VLAMVLKVIPRKSRPVLCQRQCCVGLLYVVRGEYTVLLVLLSCSKNQAEIPGKSARLGMEGSRWQASLQ